MFKLSIDELVEMATDPMFDAATPGDAGVLQQGLPTGGGPTMDYRLNPSYQQGGLVTPSGPAAGGASAGPVPMQGLEQEMQRMVQQNPEMILKIKQAITQALQTGMLSQQELNMAVQLATAAAQNPQLWPQLRQFAIQQGLADEASLPQEYDQGLVFSVLLAAKAAQGQGGSLGGAPQSQGQPPATTMQQGGEVPESRNTDGSVAINAHKGEYVIPEHVVRAKGTDFFDKRIGTDDTTEPKTG